MTPSRNEFGDIAFHLHRGMLLFALILSLIVVAGGIVVAVEGSSRWASDPFLNLFNRSIGVICVFTVLPVGILCARNLLQKGPALVVSTSGLVNRHTLFGVHEIQWSEINRISIGRSGPEKPIYLHLKNPELVHARKNSLGRLVARLNFRRRDGDITISAGFLNVSAEALFATMLRYHGAFGRVAN